MAHTACMHACTHAHTACMHAHTHAQTHTYTCTHTGTHMHTHAHISLEHMVKGVQTVQPPQFFSILMGSLTIQQVL